MVGLHRRATELFDQQAGDEQRLIADHFGRQPQARGMRQQTVVGIALQRLGRFLGRLAVGRAHHHGFQDLFDAPAFLLELDRQPVQQLGMRRLLALRAEVVDGFYQPGAEKRLPQAVDRHAGGQRVFLADDPAGQPQAVVGSILRQGRQNGRNAAPHFFQRRVIGAALQHVGRPRLGQFLHHHHGGNAGLEPEFLLLERAPLFPLAPARRRAPRRPERRRAASGAAPRCVPGAGSRRSGEGDRRRPGRKSVPQWADVL